MFCVPFLSFLAPIKSSKIAWKRFIVSLVFLEGQSNAYWYIGWNELRQWLMNPKSSTVNLNAGVQRYGTSLAECFGKNVIICNVMSSSWWIDGHVEFAGTGLTCVLLVPPWLSLASFALKALHISLIWKSKILSFIDSSLFIYITITLDTCDRLKPITIMKMVVY